MSDKSVCKLHVVFDFTFIYYKYKFTVDSGRLKMLGDYRNTMMYYCMKEVEGIRKTACKAMECSEDKLITSICFDSRTDRKDEDSEYKANRVSKLSEDDFSNIECIKEAFKIIGYNVRKTEGYEADDLVYTSIKRSSYVGIPLCIIVTCDKDLLSLVNNNVFVYRYRQSSGYELVAPMNFEGYTEKCFKCNIPLGAMKYYLATVGDKSDNISGIRGFGVSAFNKMVTSILNELGTEAFKGNEEMVQNLIEMTLTDEQKEQFRNSISLVEFRDDSSIAEVNKNDNNESRKEVYELLKYSSLV